MSWNSAGRDDAGFVDMGASSTGRETRAELPRQARPWGGSDRIPGEDVGGPVERVEGALEGGQHLLGEARRRPAFGAMDRAQRTRLAHQEALVLAHREDLAGDLLR